MVFFAKGNAENVDKGVRAGKSFGVCAVCGQKFKLKKKTKHNKNKLIKAKCGECSIKQSADAKKKN